MVLDLVPLWTILLGLGVFYYVVFDGFDLGRRHALRPGARRRGARHRDEFDRAGLGRQRDLADIRRTRLAHRFSACVRDHHSRRLFPNPDDVVGAGFPRRRIRIPVRDTGIAALVGYARFPAALWLRHSRKASCLAHSSRVSSRRPAIYRHCFRLAFRHFPSSRAGVNIRLCAVGRLLAHPENRRRTAGLGATRRPVFPLSRFSPPSPVVSIWTPLCIPTSRSAGSACPNIAVPLPGADRYRFDCAR